MTRSAGAPLTSRAGRILAFGHAITGRRPMPTNADLAAKLLRDVARHYRILAEENPDSAKTLEHNARTCEEVAELVEKDPTGEIDKAARPKLN